jgi:hypothetical protein
MGLSYIVAAGPRQRSHSPFRVQRDSWPHFTLSDSRRLQPGGLGPPLHVPKEMGGPVISPGTGFTFRLPLRLAGLRWNYVGLCWWCEYAGWIGLTWLRIGTSGGLLWTRYWTFGFDEMLGGSWGAAQLTASQEGLSSVNKWVSKCGTLILSIILYEI